MNGPTRGRLSAAVIGAAVSTTLLSAVLADASPRVGPAVGYPGGPQEVVAGGAGTCYQQLDGDSGVAIDSQKFEPEFRAFNNRGADDFTLNRSCTLRSVDVAGTYFDAPGPVDSESVVVYADQGGGPGDVIIRQTVVGSDETGNGSFHMVLKRAVRLSPGTYWLAVRANMDFAVGGQWGWETTSVLHGTGAMWKNPGDGFGTGCTTYGNMRSCIGDIGQGPDFMFSVNDSR